MSEPAEVVDAEVVAEHNETAPGVALEVAPRQRRSEVIRPLNADELAESFQQYQELLPRLLDASDYQAAEAGKRFVKKSGWRKIATAFDLDVQIVGEEVERDTDGRILRAKTTARATAPSGRVMDGDGYCTTDEFTGRRANNPKLENDLRGTAATRAKNRAISDLVGMGEVSAEEAAPPDQGAPPPQIISEAEKGPLVDALVALTGAPDRATLANLWHYLRGELERPTVEVAKAILAVHAQRAAFDDNQVGAGREAPPPDEETAVAAVQATFDATEETPA